MSARGDLGHLRSELLRAGGGLVAVPDRERLGDQLRPAIRGLHRQQRASEGGTRKASPRPGLDVVPDRRRALDHAHILAIAAARRAQHHSHLGLLRDLAHLLLDAPQRKDLVPDPVPKQ